MSSTIDQGNPLLKIDTSFQSYLVLHSLTTKSTEESLNYAFETEAATRQIMSGISGWNKLYKVIVSTDIPGSLKKYFVGAVTADAWNNTDIYDIAKTCAERLQTRLPAIMINTKIIEPIILAASAEGIEPSIIISSGLINMCDAEELTFILATAISRTQNNHCIFNFTAPYINMAEGTEKQRNFTRIESVSKQLNYSMEEWVFYSEITTDRAALICLDDPTRFPYVLKSILDKQIPLYLKPETTEHFDNTKALELSKSLRFTAVRDIRIDEELDKLTRRILCAQEFLHCETYYNCRPDLEQGEHAHTVTKQMVDLRCDIIIGVSKGVE